jgi:hypothetical protein
VTINIGQAVGSGNSPTFAGLTLTTTLAISNASGRLDVSTGSYGVYLTASEDSAASNYGHLTFVASSFKFNSIVSIGATFTTMVNTLGLRFGSDESRQGIEWYGSGWSSGYGHRLRTYDASVRSTTQLYLEARSNSASWSLLAEFDASRSMVIFYPTTALNINTGALQMGGTTVIDASRNLTNIGTISSVGNAVFATGATKITIGSATIGSVYLSSNANSPYLSYGQIADSFTFSDTSRHWMTINTSAVTISFNSTAAISSGAITTSGNIKNVQSLAGYVSIGAVNTNTAQSAGFYFAQVNDGSTPAYLIRYGSTHSTIPEQLAIVNSSTVGHIRFVSSKTTGTAFEFYANGATRATIDAAGNGVFNGTLNVASGFVTTDLQPSTDGGLNLGTQSKKWSNFYMSGAQVMVKRSDTGSSPTSNTEVHWFIYDSGGSGYYVVFKWNDGGTVRYKYMRLDGTSTTWTHATTLPV